MDADFDMPQMVGELSFGEDPLDQPMDPNDEDLVDAPFAPSSREHRLRYEEFALQAVNALREKKGSTMRDIRKYILSNCDADPDTLPDMKILLKSAAKNGLLHEFNRRFSIPGSSPQQDADEDEDEKNPKKVSRKRRRKGSAKKSSKKGTAAKTPKKSRRKRTAKKSKKTAKKKTAKKARKGKSRKTKGKGKSKGAKPKSKRRRK